MAKGIVRVKPTVTSRPHMGQVILTEAEPNQWRLAAGSPMSFNDNPPLVVKEGDIVECTFLSQTECKVTKIVGQMTMAQGTVTSLPVHTDDPTDEELGWIKVTKVSNPNPCNVQVGADVHFTAPKNFTVNKNDTVECLPFAYNACDITDVLVHA